MCNKYAAELEARLIAEAFDARIRENFNAGPGEVNPGTPGMVVREEDSGRVLQGMTWGFPLRLKSMKPGTKPKPVNNIADLSNFMWRFVAPKPEHRCLIPLTRWAEAEGPKGSKTRTWLSVKGQPIFAWAGLWKQSDEWGPVYSGLMTDANETAAAVHHRMPALLQPDDYDRWLHGSIDDVKAFQGRVFPPELIAIDRTDDPWFRRKAGRESNDLDNLS